jgi:hypothetical protein
VNILRSWAWACTCVPFWVFITAFAPFDQLVDAILMCIIGAWPAPRP